MRATLGLVVAAMLMTACGSTGTGTGGGSGGGSSAGGGAGGGSAGGGAGGGAAGGSGGGTAGGAGGGAAGGAGGGAAGGGAGGGGGGTGGKVGFVSVSQLEGLPLFGTARSGSAAFYVDGSPMPQGATVCTNSGAAGCEISDCYNDGGLPTFTGGTTAGAGTVSVTVGALTIPLTPGTTGLYSGSRNDGGLWWTGGEMVSATGTGSTDGGVPAFNFNNVLSAPARLVVTAPVNDGGVLTVQKNVALPITWNAGGPGRVEISLISGKLFGGRSVKVVCSPNASAGAFTIPAAATNLLLSGPGGSLQLTNRTEGVQNAGDWSVFTSASSTAPTQSVTVP